MIRDFSESAKQKLLAYVKDVTETTVWGKLGDIIGDIGLQVQHWFGALDISKHVNNLDEYHKKVIDKNDTTSQRIEEIFTNVKNIDIRYQNGLGQELSYANSITDMIKVLSDTIDPNGGNMNLQKMNEALAASLEKIRENQLSKNKVIEDSMLGTDPDAAEISADPVNLSTGNFVYDHQDLIVGGEIPLVFHRYYNSKDTRVGTLGKCFLHNYEVLIEDSNDGVLGIRQADGQVIRYEKDNDGNYHSNTSALEILKKTETGYVLENIGKERKLFKSDGKLIRQENWNGRGISFSYNEKNQLVKAKTDNESCFEYFYDESSGYLTKVQDHTGRCVDLTYKNGMLEKVALPLDIVYTYTYGSNGRIIEVVNAREIHAVKNEYDKKYRVTKQFFPDVEFGGDLLDQKVLQKKEDLDYTHAISNGLWSATTTLVVGGITNEISNVIHPEAKTGTMDYLFGRDKAKAVVKAQYNNARSSSSRAKYWNRLEKIKLQKTLGTIKYGIIETGKTIIDEIKNEIYRDEVNEDIVEEIDKKISCSVY